METYEDSPETTFIGMTMGKGYGPILERYQQGYATREQMGTLTFNDLEVRLLPVVRQGGVRGGDRQLPPGAHARGEAKKDDGIFSLVWRKGPQGWKIVLDHTS